LRRLVRPGIRVAITAGLFLLLFRPSLLGLDVSFIPVSLDALWAEITGLEGMRFWTWIGVAFALKGIGIAASITKWGLLLQAQAIRLPVPSLTAIFLMGRFFGTFLPGTIGLDGFRLYEVARRTGRTVESATVILFDKLAGFVALTTLVALTLPLGYQPLLEQRQLHPGLLQALVALFGTAAGAALVLLGLPQVLRLGVERGARWIPARLGGPLRSVARAVSAYQGRRRVVGAVLVLGVLSHAATSLMYFATAMALATAGVTLGQVLFAAPVVIFGTVLGPSIGGEGIREAMFVYLLGPVTGTAKAFLASHLGFWVEEAFSLVGGGLYLLSPRRRAPGTDPHATAVRGLPSATAVESNGRAS